MPFEVEAASLVREVGQVGLPALFATADYAAASRFLVVDRQPNGVVLGLTQRLARKQPVRTGAVVVEAFVVQRRLPVEPGRLGQAAHHRGYERLGHLGHDPAEQVQSVSADDVLNIDVRITPADQAAERTEKPAVKKVGALSSALGSP